MAGRHKDPLQKHLSGLCPFLPPSREQSKQAGFLGTGSLRVSCSAREGMALQGGEAGLGERDTTWQEA